MAAEHTTTDGAAWSRARHRAFAGKLAIIDERKIVQTAKSHQMTSYQAGWRDKNPDSRYELFTDESMHAWVHAHFATVPALVVAWDALPDIVRRATTVPTLIEQIIRSDLFRLMILFAEGGIYSDSDTV